MSKTLHRNLQAKIAVLDGPEWDSSDEEEDVPVEPVADKKSKKKHGKESKKGRASKDKKSQNTQGKAEVGGEEEDDKDKLVLYIGHLPKEFEEKDLRNFLSQFGKVHHCRVARKIETGNPKGFAFVKFADSEVARIVCDTLHGYFLGKQRLVCQLRPSYPGMFFDTDTVIAKRKEKIQLQKKRHDRNLATAEKLKEITARLITREQKKREKLQALGIDYDFPGYTSNQSDYAKQIAQGKDDDKDTAPDNANEISATRKRKDSVGSEGSAKKQRKRKDSVDSEGSAKKKKRKDSVDGEGSAKKSKRKESIDSVGSEGSAKKSKRKNSVESEASESKDTRKRKDSMDAKEERLTKSATKAKKKKDKKRRTSAP